MNVADETRAAFALLTRLPVRDAGVSPDATGAAMFGVVGAALGLVGAVPLIVFARGASEPLLGAIAGVAMVAACSGFFHLDGLADTVDALLVADPERSEAARRDPALGAGGVATIVLVLAAQIAALASLAGGANGGLAAATWVAALTVSRIVPTVAVRIVPAEGGRGGLGAWFAERVRSVDAAFAVATAAILVGAAALTIRPPTDAGVLLVGATVGGAVGLAAAVVLAAARGGLDGDGLGASVELTTVAVLVTAALLAA